MILNNFLLTLGVWPLCFLKFIISHTHTHTYIYIYKTYAFFINYFIYDNLSSFTFKCDRVTKHEIFCLLFDIKYIELETSLGIYVKQTH